MNELQIRQNNPDHIGIHLKCRDFAWSSELIGLADAVHTNHLLLTRNTLKVKTNEHFRILQTILNPI